MTNKEIEEAADLYCKKLKGVNSIDLKIAKLNFILGANWYKLALSQAQQLDKIRNTNTIIDNDYKIEEHE